jgi:protein TonB
VAVLDFGETQAGRRAADKLSATIAANAELALTDRDWNRAAALGAGYTGSLNLALAEARDLGAALGADFYLLGDAQVLRRSTSEKPVYYEAYASIFFVSTRTGRLISWERPSFEAATPAEAERLLFRELGGEEVRHRYLIAVRRALEDERRLREMALASPAPLIEGVPEETSAAAAGLRLPAPYRRIQPVYPDTAARAGAEGVVDVEVSIDETGKPLSAKIVRWAGFGLDEAVIETVRQLHFRPATRDGVALPMRVLLRYNFRHPVEEGKGQK